MRLGGGREAGRACFAGGADFLDAVRESGEIGGVCVLHREELGELVE